LNAVVDAADMPSSPNRDWPPDIENDAFDASPLGTQSAMCEADAPGAPRNLRALK
jgi:hypothetical protein